MRKDKIIPVDLVQFANKFEEFLLLELKANGVDCQGNRDAVRTSIKHRNKYFAVDYGTSGKFLVDKDMNVYSIKAYGQKGYLRGSLNEVSNQIEKNIETLQRVLNEGIKMYSLEEI